MARLKDFWTQLPPRVPGIIKGIRRSCFIHALSPALNLFHHPNGTTMIFCPLHKFAPLFLFLGLPGAFPPHSAPPFPADKLHTNHSSSPFLHAAFPDYPHTLQTGLSNLKCPRQHSRFPTPPSPTGFPQKSFSIQSIETPILIADQVKNWHHPGLLSCMNGN